MIIPKTIAATAVFFASALMTGWSTTLLAADAEQEETAITQLETDWSTKFGAGDLDGIMKLMAEHSVLIMPGSPPINDLEGIRDATREMLDAGPSVSWKSDFAFVSPSGDMAYDYGTSTTTLEDGETVKGHYLVVWVKENGEWKVAADMFN